MPFPGPNIEGQTMTVGAISPGSGRFLVPLYVQLAQIVNSTDVLNYPLTFKGRLMAIGFSVQSKVTTAGKAATLTAKVKSGATTTNMTGGVLSLTSTNCTPEAAVVAGTAITALNKFQSGDSLVLSATAVTAFSEGTGYIMLTLINDDTLDVVGRDQGLFSENP